jgi:hypothetical protein
MTRTGQIVVAGYINNTSSDELARKLIPYLEKWDFSQGKYRSSLNDDDTNFFVNFRDKSNSELYICQYQGDSYNVSIHSDNNTIDMLPLVEKIAGFFQELSLEYRIEVMYEYEDGRWEEETTFGS